MNSLKRTIFVKISLLFFFILITLFSMNHGQLKIMNNFQNNFEIIRIFPFAIASIITLILIILLFIHKPQNTSNREITLSSIIIICTLINWLLFFENQYYLFSNESIFVTISISFYSFAELAIGTATLLIAIADKCHIDYKEVD